MCCAVLIGSAADFRIKTTEKRSSFQISQVLTSGFFSEPEGTFEGRQLLALVREREGGKRKGRGGDVI